MQRVQQMALAMGLAGLMAASAAMAQAHAGTPPTAPPQKPQAAAEPAPVPTGPAVEAQRSYAAVKANILKAADKMPVEDYLYKPEPDIRTYAQVVDHIAEVQMHNCGAVNRAEPETLTKIPAATADKAVILEALKASFEECDKAYASLTDSNLSTMFAVGTAKRSRIGLLWGTVSHDNEQYATLTLYLRLKDIVPPSSEK